MLLSTQQILVCFLRLPNSCARGQWIWRMPRSAACLGTVNEVSAVLLKCEHLLPTLDSNVSIYMAMYIHSMCQILFCFLRLPNSCARRLSRIWSAAPRPGLWVAQMESTAYMLLSTQQISTQSAFCDFPTAVPEGCRGSGALHASAWSLRWLKCEHLLPTLDSIYMAMYIHCK